MSCPNKFYQPVRRALVLVAALVGPVTVTLLVSAQPERADWPRFRGPDGSGIAPFGELPLAWDVHTGDSIIWKTPLPLPGSSSPIISGGRVLVTGADESQREVYCLDAERGDLLWTAPVGEGNGGEMPLRLHRMNSYAAPTATTDGEMVYAVFPSGHVTALDFDGGPGWQRRFDMSRDIYGHASSLVLHKGLLLLQIDLGKPDIDLSYMVALDKGTGETVWRVRRPVQGSWTTPIIINTGARDELITSAKPWVIAYDPLTGREYWRVNCVDGDSAPSPIYANGHVYVANIYASLVAIRPGGTGDVTDTRVTWSAKGSLPDICSPLTDGELVFVLATNGVLSCYDAGAGALLWTESLGRRFRSSPSLVGDRVYLLSETGESIVVAAAREYRPLATGHLREPVYSCPAFASGRMYVRGEQHLFCIGSR